ncbi:MAG TPA: hypothetical protein VGU61_12335, partial [Noviherbaspirillum sp.]|nr:hypothetical protein [Noviherbaspirillum sp.]
INKTLSDNAALEIWVEVIENYPERRIDVAQNRTIPEEVMQILASFDDATVRSLIAQKRRLVPDLFPLLARDQDETVRIAIAANQKIPLELVRSLTTDSIESVASVAEYNLRERLKNVKNPK